LRFQLRKVFIVVADGISFPSWLNVNNPRLRIVRHSEIFSSSKLLPTFNSHAIESRLHMISDLAERFIYLNDDMFINRYVRPSTFFSIRQQPRVWPHGQVYATATDGHTLAVLNTLRWTKGTRSNWPGEENLNHHGKALTKTMLKRAYELYGSQLMNTESHAFREKTDVWPILLASIICVEERLCTKERPPSTFAANIDVDETPEHAMGRIVATNPTFVCLNDSNNGSKAPLVTVLQRHFPNKSTFEI
jgi:hypothetical protein